MPRLERATVEPVEIDALDPASLAQDAVILVLGKRGTGKSTVAEDILSYHTNITEGICVSRTDRMNGFWSRHIPELFIHDTFEESTTAKLLKHQEEKWMVHKRECRAKGRVPRLRDIEPAFAIYDDMTYDKGFLRNPTIRELLMTGRHYGILTIITCQYLMDMGPDLRANIDYVIMLNDNSHANRQKLFEQFGGMFRTHALFERVFAECTVKRGALVLDNRSQSHLIRDCVFHYHAEPDREYVLGSPAFWAYAQEHGRAREDGSENEKYQGMSEAQRRNLMGFDVHKRYPNTNGSRVPHEGAPRTPAPYRLANAEKFRGEETRDQWPDMGGNSTRGDSDSEVSHDSDIFSIGDDEDGGQDFYEDDDDDNGKHEDTIDLSSEALHAPRHSLPKQRSAVMPQAELPTRRKRTVALPRVPQPRVFIGGRARRRLKTDVLGDYTPVDSFGEDVLREIDTRREARRKAKRSVKLAKGISSAERASQRARVRAVRRALEARERAAAAQKRKDELFLY